MPGKELILFLNLILLINKFLITDYDLFKKYVFKIKEAANYSLTASN